MTEVYKTDELMNTLIRNFRMLQFRGLRKPITNDSKHIHRNATYGLQNRDRTQYNFHYKQFNKT